LVLELQKYSAIEKLVWKYFDSTTVLWKKEELFGDSTKRTIGKVFRRLKHISRNQ
jgi:hypothetical protein